MYEDLINKIQKEKTSKKTKLSNKNRSKPVIDDIKQANNIDESKIESIPTDINSNLENSSNISRIPIKTNVQNKRQIIELW